MFADATRSANPRSGSDRRTFAGRVSLLAAMSCLTLGLVVGEPLVAAKPHSRAANAKQVNAEKQKSGKTISRTFSSPNAVLINDNTPASPFPASIQVSGIKKGKVTDVNVVLRGVNHGYTDDIDVMLIAPNGASTVLMSDAGGANSAGSLTLRFDDEVSGTLPDSTTLASGSFQPVNYGPADSFPGIGTPPATVSLAQLDGGNPNGTWRLYVLDDNAANIGAFSGGWDLELEAKLDKKKKHGHGGKH